MTRYDFGKLKSAAFIVNNNAIDPGANFGYGPGVFRNKNRDFGVRILLLEQGDGRPGEHEVAKLVIAYNQNFHFAWLLEVETGVMTGTQTSARLNETPKNEGS